MMDLINNYELAKIRQAELLAMAQRQPTGPILVLARQRAGRLIVQVGRWIEGHQPEIFHEDANRQPRQSTIALPCPPSGQATT